MPVSHRPDSGQPLAINGGTPLAFALKAGDARDFTAPAEYLKTAICGGDGALKCGKLSLRTAHAWPHFERR